MVRGQLEIQDFARTGLVDKKGEVFVQIELISCDFTYARVHSSASSGNRKRLLFDHHLPAIGSVKRQLTA